MPQATAGTDTRARAVLLEAWQLEARQPPTLAAVQAVQAVGRLETFYGQWGSWLGSNNWGAITCSKGPTAQGQCGPGCIFHFDHDANGKRVGSCFRVYGSPLEGARDLIRTMVFARSSVAAVIDAGDVDAIATAMHATGYFVAPVAQYAAAMMNHATLLTKAMGERLVLRHGGGLAHGEIAKRSIVPSGLAAAAGVAIGVLAFAWLDAPDEKKARKTKE